MTPRSTVCLAASLLLWSTLAPAVQAQPKGGEQAVREWLQNRLGPEEPTEDSPPGRYTLGWSDLNGDGRPEALAYVSGRPWCGTGGCRMYVLEVRRASIRLLGRTTVTRPPISVLGTRTHGYRDLAVRVCGGGILRCYRARLQFDGWKYMSNPSKAYAVEGRPAEQLIIRDDDPGREIFGDEDR